MFLFWASAGLCFAMTFLAWRAALRRLRLTDAGRAANHPLAVGGWTVLLAWWLALWRFGPQGAFSDLYPFWACLGIVFAMGAIDDAKRLSPLAKLLAQMAAAGLFLALLDRTGQLPLTLWTPVFFVWIVGITNSINLLDNMDGLAPGFGAIACLAFSVLFFDASSPQAALCQALAGGLAAFLAFNFHPARLYLGDAGSHLAGFSLAALPLYCLANPAGKEEVLVPIILLAVPIIDTTFVTLSRLKRGVPVWQGGKDHISHRLEWGGLPVKLVAAVFYAAAALSWYLAAQAGGG